MSFVELFILVVFLAVVIVMARSIREANLSAYLLLSVEGISYRAGSREMLCRWNEVASFIERPFPQLIVTTGGRSYANYMITKNPNDDPCIPLYKFAYSPNSELAKELRRYLPHLFS